VDAESIAAAVTYLDASHGCVLQSSAVLWDSEGERAKGKQKKEWSRDTTTATTSTSVSPSARTSTSTSTDTNTDSSPLITKQKQSQRPGVFDINTGSTAYPISSSPPASVSVSVTVGENLQVSQISSSSSDSGSDSGSSRTSPKGVGRVKSSMLTENEEALLSMLTSTDENGEDKGIVLHFLSIMLSVIELHSFTMK
jgi:hypothetical protein